MSESKLTPLQYNVGIVNPDGTPTPYFIQLLQQLYEEKAVTDALAAAAVPETRHIVAGAGLTGGGDLSADRTLSADVQAILNLVSTTRGAILYRGAAAWSALLPGTSGNFLKTLGAGADPIWDVAGGGAAAWDFLPPLAAGFTKISGDATQLTLADDADVGLLVDHGVFTAGYVQRTAYKTLSNKSLDWTLVAKFKRAFHANNYRDAGIMLRDSISARALFHNLRVFTGSVELDVLRYNDLIGTGGVASSALSLQGGYVIEWQRVRHTGGSYFFDVSPNGKQWANQYSLVDTAHTTNRADQIGFCSLYWNSSGTPGWQLQYSIPYWSLTGPGV